jgi:hypothetical protein
MFSKKVPVFPGYYSGPPGYANYPLNLWGEIKFLSRAILTVFGYKKRVPGDIRNIEYGKRKNVKNRIQMEEAL